MFHSKNNRSVFQDDDRDGKHRRKSKDYGSNFDDQQGSSSRHRDVRFSFVETMCKASIDVSRHRNRKRNIVAKAMIVMKMQ